MRFSVVISTSTKPPTPQAFHEETIRKLSKLHLYDCLRANKSLSAWGVEGRVPSSIKNSWMWQ